MNRIQENLYELLIEFDNICNEHGIEYYLAYGNALGAIRHNRFLPWDDDVDLFITRDNFNKLLHLIETENIIPKTSSLICSDNTKYYRNPLARYVSSETTNIYKSQSLAAKACGQQIELFILDPLPNDEEEKQEYMKLFRAYAELNSPYFVVCYNLSLEEWEEHYSLYKDLRNRADIEGEEKVLKELESKLFNFPKDECEQYHVRWGLNDHIFDKAFFEGKRFEKFEGKQFPIPSYSEGVFRFFYGDDWMYVPQISNQKTHNALRNLDVPFNEYTDNYLEKINQDEIFNQYRKYKYNNADLFYKRRIFDKSVAKIKVDIESNHICAYLEDKEHHLRSLLENRKYDDLLKEFEEYILLQMGEDIKKYRISVPISDRNLATLLLCLIEQGNYYESDKFLDIRKAQKNPLNDELNEIDKLINFCRKLSIARYDNRDALLVNSLIDEYEQSYPNLLDIYRAKLWIKEMNAKSVKDYESINNLCDEILQLYPFDGETMAYKAHAKLECGLKEEAVEIYKKSIKFTRNGFIWQKVEDEIGLSRIEIEREIIGS